MWVPKFPGQSGKKGKNNANNNQLLHYVSREAGRTGRDIEDEVTCLIELSKPLRFKQMLYDYPHVERVLSPDPGFAKLFESYIKRGWWRGPDGCP
jgi:hypothetical protein